MKLKKGVMMKFVNCTIITCEMKLETGYSMAENQITNYWGKMTHRNMFLMSFYYFLTSQSGRLTGMYTKLLGFWTLSII
jgi:hypothetical protein